MNRKTILFKIKKIIYEYGGSQEKKNKVWTPWSSNYLGVK